MPSVAFFGPSGTFAEEALLTQGDLAARERVPVIGVPDVIAAVESGECELGFVPIENSIEGSVSVTIDTLAFESDLLIQREVDLPISMGLFVKPGTKFADVQQVLSFPIAAAQCRAFLREHLPQAVFVAANSTADAAATVARSERTDQAAIGNPLAAEIHGLEVLAREIADHPENQTRFVVVGRGIPARTGHDKTTIVCFQRADRPGSLLAMLQEFAAPRDQPHQAGVAPDEEEPRRLLLRHRRRGPHLRRAGGRLSAHARGQGRTREVPRLLPAGRRRRACPTDRGDQGVA